MRNTTRTPASPQCRHGLGCALDHLLGQPHDAVAVEEPGHDRRSCQSAGAPCATQVRWPAWNPSPAFATTRARSILDDVVSPPYDVVSPAERAELAARSPYNAIHVELPVPDEAAGLDRYDNAARIFRGWLDAGVVRRDAVPGFYLYQMKFHDEHGHLRTTTGLLGALGLDPGGTGQVLPHEQTIPKDRKDRLSLLRSTRLNTSPIWGLSLATGLSSLCRDAVSHSRGDAVFGPSTAPGWSTRSGLSPTPSRVAEIEALASTAPVLIADGHHRYETACIYAEEVRKSNGDRPGPHDLVMAFIVELSEEELSIRAIHRLVKGVPAGRLTELLSSFFRIEPAPDDLVALPATTAPGVIGLATPDGFWLLYPLPAVSRGGRGRPRLGPPRGRPGGARRRRAHLPAGVAPGDRGGPRRPRGCCVPAAAGPGHQDRERRLRRSAHASQEHVLRAEAPHGNGLPPARGLSAATEPAERSQAAEGPLAVFRLYS